MPHASQPPAPVELLRLVILAAATLVAAAALEATEARADDLIVRYDQSQLLRLSRPPAEIIVGNPSIADVTIQGANLLVVTGKTFGTTNIIALDAERNVIQDQRVVVQRDESRTVNLVKAGVRQSYSCTPDCSPTLTIGDDEKFFDMVSKHNSSKTRFSEGSGDNNGQAGSQ